jgi:hypothetical protein
MVAAAWIMAAILLALALLAVSRLMHAVFQEQAR